MGDHRKRENIKPANECHMFLALRREKDNQDGYDGLSVFREVIRDEAVDLKVIQAKCEAMGGSWRIYHTVNKRCFSKAFKLFQHRLIDDDVEYLHRLDSLWKNCLLKSESRAEKFFMIDFDGNINDYMEFKEHVQEDDIHITGLHESPNGFHIITDPFKVTKDSKDKGRCFTYRGMDVLKDGYYFVKTIGGEKNNEVRI